MMEQWNFLIKMMIRSISYYELVLLRFLVRNFWKNVFSMILHLISFVVSMLNYLLILVTAIVKRTEIRYLHRFFVKCVKCEEISLRTTFTQKMQFTLIIFLMIIVLPFELTNTMMLCTKFFSNNFLYVYSLQYIVFIALIHQFINSINFQLKRYLTSSREISIEFLMLLEEKIDRLFKILDLFNSIFNFSIFITITNYTMALISHIYIVHILFCNNVLLNQRISALPFFGKGHWNFKIINESFIVRIQYILDAVCNFFPTILILIVLAGHSTNATLDVSPSIIFGRGFKDK